MPRGDNFRNYGPNAAPGIDFTHWTQHDYKDGKMHEITSSQHQLRIVQSGINREGKPRYAISNAQGMYLKGGRGRARRFGSIFTAIVAADEAAKRAAK